MQIRSQVPRNQQVTNVPIPKIGTDLYRKSVQQKGFSKTFSRVPLEVSMDGRLTGSDKAVYTALSYLVWKSKDKSYTGSLMDIAITSDTARSTVQIAIVKLVNFGHVKREGRQRQVSRFTLTSIALTLKDKKVLLSDSASDARIMDESHRLGQRVGKCSKCKSETSVKNSFEVCEPCLDALRARLAESNRKAS